MLSWLRERQLDLSWLGARGAAGRHVFRWRDRTGRWRTAARRIQRSERLLAELARYPPLDVYVGTAAWLEPVRLPRLRDPGPPPVLLDHLVVFDIDRAPFSRENLDLARRDTLALLDWLAAHTELELVHVVFSGSKGFHVVLRDPDRTPFRIAQPRARERSVRDARAALLARVRAAGHDVDPTVTADTRRIVRLPGTLHGATRWACTIVANDTLRRPIAEWIDSIPRAPDAVPLPESVPSPGPPVAKPPVPQRREAALALQASSHVVGTRDRGAILAWTAAAPETLATRARAAGLGPLACWRAEGRTLVLVPRAFPPEALGRAADALRLRGFAAALVARGHAWVDVAPREGERAPVEPAGVVAGGACAHPWSRPHLDLARRLGQPIEAAGASANATCGSERARMRLAQIS